MLNICLDSYLDSVNNQDYQEQILKHLKQLSEVWRSENTLLIQLRDNHQEDVIQVLFSKLALHGWPENSYRLHRWSPIQGISTVDPINQTLRNHAACWQGSHLELCFEHWPQTIPETAIPQALVIVDTEWSPSYREQFRLNLSKFKLNLG